MNLDEERKIWSERARKAEEEAVASGSRFRYIGEVIDGQIVNDRDTSSRNSFANRLNRGEHLRFLGKMSKAIPEKTPEPEEPPRKTWRDQKALFLENAQVFGTSSAVFGSIVVYSYIYNDFVFWADGDHLFANWSVILGIPFFALFLLALNSWRNTPDSDEVRPEYIKYLDDLIKALKDNSKNVRYNAAQTLEELEWEQFSFPHTNSDEIRSNILLAKGDSDLNLEDDMNQAGDVVPKKEATEEMDEEEKNSTSGRSIVLKDNVVRRSGVGGLEKYETEHERDDTGNELIINILSKEEARKRRVQKAKERESALDYDSAIEIWEQLGQISEAGRVRKLKADLAAPKTEIHGDYIDDRDTTYVDDRDTTIQDSVVSKSNVGSGGKSKAEELREVKALLDDGIIDDDEFQQMKKEILGEKVKKIIKKTRKLRR